MMIETNKWIPIGIEYNYKTLTNDESIQQKHDINY